MALSKTDKPPEGLVPTLPILTYTFTNQRHPNEDGPVDAPPPVPRGPNEMWWMWGAWLGRLRGGHVVSIECHGHIAPVHNFCGGMFASSLYARVNAWKESQMKDDYYSNLCCLPSTPARSICTLRGNDVADVDLAPASQLIKAHGGLTEEKRNFYPDACVFLGIKEFESVAQATHIAHVSLCSAIVSLARSYRRGMVFGTDRIEGQSVESIKHAGMIWTTMDCPLFVTFHDFGEEAALRPPLTRRLRKFNAVHTSVGSAMTKYDASPATFVRDVSPWINRNSGSQVGMWRVPVDLTSRGASYLELKTAQKAELRKFYNPSLLARLTGGYFYN